MNLLPKPKAKSLKRSLTGAVLRSVMIVGAFGASFMAAGAGSAQFAAIPEQGIESNVMDDRPVAKGSPQDLIEKHKCWTGEAPADMQGQMPGHVVVTKGVAPVYGGSHLVGQALEQIFEGKDHGLTVHGFCR